MMRKFILLLSLCICIPAFCQDDFEDLDFKLGIKTSANISLLTGTELMNPRPKFGYTAGAFGQININKRLFFQPEIVASFRGSNFANSNDTGSTYSKITTFYLDVSPLLGYRLSEEGKEHQVLLGPYAGYHFLSSLFLDDSKVPLQNGLPLKPLDIGLAGYYQIISSPVGFQFGVKASFIDMNDGIQFTGINPPTGNGGLIKNLSFEIGMLF